MNTEEKIKLNDQVLTEISSIIEIIEYLREKKFSPKIELKALQGQSNYLMDIIRKRNLLASFAEWKKNRLDTEKEHWQIGHTPSHSQAIYLKRILRND